MRVCSFFLTLCVSSTVLAGELLTIERLFSDPELSGPSPRALRYAPDGSRVTLLKAREDDYERYDLWEYHIADQRLDMLVDSQALVAGEEQLSDEEKARRERQRIFGRGIMEYVWADDSASILFPLAGDIYRFDLASKSSRRLTHTPGFETDVRTSPQGRYVSFVREQNLFAIDLANDRERQLTRDGGGPIKNGMAEFVAQEEMGRYTGYWWSPDERYLAYLQVDESPVDRVTRSEIYADRIDTITQRYPAAGRPNVRLRLGILELASAQVRWLELGEADDFYIPRVQWANKALLTYQWQSRNQQSLELRAVEAASGATRVLLKESSPTWVNLHDDLRFLADSERFIWSSERSGYRHLYLYSLKDGEIGALTAGEWAVDALAAVDEAGGQLFFTGRKDTPLERHLYRVPLSFGKVNEPLRVSSRAGTHDITFADDATTYLDSFSSVRVPPQVSLHAARGERLAWVEENALAEGHPLYPYQDELIEPEFGSFTASEGHELYYRIYKPRGFDAAKRYPVLQYLYGGPGAQVVKNEWDRLFFPYLAQQGYVVFSVDNRGSDHRGKAFEDPIYRRMGSVEVDDQIAGARFLRSQPFVDAKRIALYGHSYGGYMTLMTLMKGSEYFAAGVSGAPVTDWLLYDTHYTERYMGHPAEDAEAYRAAAVYDYLDQLKAPLLLYHGMADDNVLFTHSTSLMKRLQDRGKQFELMTYPGKKHSLRGKQTNIHRHTLISNFLDRHLRSGS